jgi:hypothetical protein
MEYLMAMVKLCMAALGYMKQSNFLMTIMEA